METQHLGKMYGNVSSPYYIYAPRWIQSSAGIRALHYLCHALNSYGARAFLVLSEPEFQGRPRVNGALNTPVLSQEIADSHSRSGLVPIVIYSETVPGNPLNAQCVVRYIMNYVGALGGPAKFMDFEYLLSYSESIRQDILKSEPNLVIDKLFLPPIDPRDFKFNTAPSEEFYLLYAGKYRAFIGEPPDISGKKIIEILRDGKGAQTSSELIELLSRCKGVISLENSSIITEAALSGRPGMFLPNKFLTRAIAESELGWDGTAWGISEDDERIARESVSKGRDRYMDATVAFEIELKQFVTNTQNFVIKFSSSSDLKVPNYKYLASKHRIGLAIQIYSAFGARTLFKVVLNFMRRRLAPH